MFFQIDFVNARGSFKYLSNRASNEAYIIRLANIKLFVAPILEFVRFKNYMLENCTLKILNFIFLSLSCNLL